MKELFLILNLTFRNKRRRGKKGLFSWKIQTPLAILVPGTIFGATIGIVLYGFLSQIPPVSILGNYTMVDFIVGIWILPVSLLFILNYAPFISMSLFGSEETQFLQTLPLRKSSIYWNFSLQSFAMAGIPIFFLIPLPIVYGIITHAGIISIIFTAFSFIFLLFGLANLAGILVSFLMSKTAAKFWGLITYFLSFFFYIGIMYSPINKTGNIDNLYNILQQTTLLKSVVFSPFSLSTWFIKSFHGNFLYQLLLPATGGLLLFLTYKLARYLDFSIERRKQRGKLKIKKRRARFPFIKKNLKILLRDPHSLYLIAFAVLFPLMISFSSDTSPIIFFGILFPFYTGLVSSRILAEDMKNLPLPFQLPITIKSILSSALIIPTILFTIAYLIIVTFSPGNTGLLYFLTPLIGLVLYICSAITLLVVLKNPDRDYTGRRILDFPETILVEIVTIIISIIILGSGYFSLLPLIEGAGNLPTALESLYKVPNFRIISTTILTASTATSIFFSIKTGEKTEKLLEEMKEG